MTSHITLVTAATAVLVTACATEAPYDPLQDYEELDSTSIVPAPRPAMQRVAPGDRDAVERGSYLVELLGCGACHTDGALEGDPDLARALAGSRTGIAYTNPLEHKNPGVVYPPNITPDEDAGIGLWSDTQIANAVRAGIGQHGNRRLATMPWQGYTKLNDDDVEAIVAYLRSIEPVAFEVPGEVRPGGKASHPFVYFGIYRSR
ncbi:MAG: cytochrome c [Gammaproteobacteria bacterium]|nr:cytochrome c [Gammaproteobacteria bacterium]NNF49038.1 c-type cytochrome [Woeseiaceae bacterium]MBT8094835.1 cytochrome c [Gammaproteobacteria bacterium]MBT8104199.1 cytochrome c [Gammaproteobacteria bacterium]NNK24214.1 c-type cytochrome [Woeseiaceae bacterium]